VFFLHVMKFIRYFIIINSSFLSYNMEIIL